MLNCWHDFTNSKNVEFEPKPGADEEKMAHWHADACLRFDGVNGKWELSAGHTATYSSFCTSYCFLLSLDKLLAGILAGNAAGYRICDVVWLADR